MNEPVAAARTSSRAIATTFAAWGAAFVLLSVALATMLGASPGRDEVATLLRSGSQLTPNNTNARTEGDAIVVANRRESPLTLLSVGALPLVAEGYGHVVIDADPLPRGVEVALIWVRQDRPADTEEQRLVVDGNGVIDPTALDTNAEWRGTVAFLAIGVKGAMDRPWTLRSFRLEPLGFRAMSAQIVTGWTAFERWDGRSINVLFGGHEEQRAWLPPLAFFASAVAALLAWGSSRRRGQRAPAVLIVLPFLIGWLVIDLRWQLNLIHQARATMGEFGGRGWAERHVAMEDGDLFLFTQAALAKLPREPVRIFVNSGHEYFRRRAGYHLYPHNVLAYDWAEPALLRPGEYLLLYQMSGVRFDTGRRELLWANGRRLAVDALLVKSGAGLFVVRPAESPP